MKNNIIHRKELISVLAFSKLHDMPYQAAVRLVRKGIVPVEVIGKLSYIDLNRLEILAKEHEMDAHTFVMRRAKYSCRRVRGGLC